MKAIALLMTVFSLIGITNLAHAQSADEKLQGTVVIRFNTKTGKAEKLMLNQEIKNKDEAKAAVAQGQFKQLPEEKMARNELDREAGASSWFWWCGGWGGWGVGWATTPTYYSYGYTYAPYYSYATVGYNYYYYGYGYRGCGYGCW